MKGVAEDLETGQKITVDLSDENIDELSSLAKERVSDTKLQSYIDNLNLSADAKALIASILKASVKVGELVIRIGKRIVEMVIMVTTKFPNASIGLVFGFLLGSLITTIPLIGAILGSFMVPIAAAFGLATGYVDDLKDKNLERRITEAAAMFRPLQGEVHVAG